ncbi:MAG: YggT family protein [Candidatus Izemoplasmatales bacterium]|jgi:YggT family protein|nr:YggT family protein [Candidatus Izemoplasmatales bacterium]
MDNILRQILYYGYYVLYVYFFIIIVQVLLSWTPIVKTRFYEFLTKITNPYMSLFRHWLVIGNIDFTPMIGLILFQVILAFIARVL